MSVMFNGCLKGISMRYQKWTKVLKDTYPVVNTVTYDEEVGKLGGSQ